MPRRLPFAMALLALCTPLWAAPPVAKVSGPDRVQVGWPFFLDASASVSDRPLKWTLRGTPRPFIRLRDEASGLVGVFVPAALPGEAYEFKLVASGTTAIGEVDADAEVIRVVVGDPAPRPPPPPDPTPGPNPPPVPPPGPGPVPYDQQLYVTLVFDLDGYAPGVGIIRTSSAVRKAAEELAIEWRSCDDDSQAALNRNLLPPVKAAGGVPALIVQVPEGDVIAALPCPSTVDGVVNLLKTFRPVKGAR